MKLHMYIYIIIIKSICGTNINIHFNVFVRFNISFIANQLTYKLQIHVELLDFKF